MKHYLAFCLLLIFISSSIRAQVGIGTDMPDPSARLDIFSNNKGLLMPRLSTIERDEIANPANGLMIYNTTTNDGQLNTGTPSVPIWTGIKSPENASHAIQSVTEGGNVSTTSIDNILIPGMTLSPLAGTYMILFNAQVSSTETTFSSEQGITDVNVIYNQLINLPGAVPHALVFGNNEVLLPGIYNVGGAASIAGTLELDGGGDPNALFVIRSSGAFTTGAGTTVILSNGATANNIFWVAEGAMSTAASTIMKGTLVAHGAAVSLGANTNLKGRMFTTIGAITMGATCHLEAPAGISPINLGVLSSFVMFSVSGAISGCPDCGIIGDVGTGAGAPTSFDSLDGDVYGAGTTSTPNTSLSTYSIYKNNIEVVNSSRSYSLPSSNITLQTMTTVAAGESIEVRWKVDSGKKAIIDNRILTLIRSY